MPSSCTPAQHPGDLPIARGTSSTAEQVTLRERWLGRYKRAVDFDQWGQVIEAIEAYARYVNSVGLSR